jgi:multiple sugar transport system substrate-binding protein
MEASVARTPSQSDPLNDPLRALADLPVGRRRVLQGLAFGALGVASSSLLAACGGDSGSKSASGGSSAAAKPTGTLTFGSNGSDDVPKAAYAAVAAAFTKQSGVQVAINTVAHNDFQEQINNYLQGKPDDVFTWFAGNRMRFFAKQGLAGDISDVWQDLKMPDSFKAAATADDGKQYFVPIYNYPWAVFYRKSVFAAKGYQVPKTIDELKTLGAQMKKDGMAPIGFADKDGWPAMGTFDILNMRINGFQFHQDLMAGKQAWDSKEVKDVFNTWRDLLPLHETNALGRTWQEAAQNLGAKKSGMYLLGSFVGQQFKGAVAADLDFFPFPAINPDHGTDSIDAPIDGLMMAKKPKNEAAATAFLRFVGTGAAQDIYLKSDPNDVAAATDASTTNYNALQKKAAELIRSTKNIAQFLDRDTRPDFASPVVIPAIQAFLKNPNDVDGVTKSLQQQAKSIFVD